MMKKEVLSRIGLLNPNFRYAHDMDLWIRALLTGYEMGYLDEPFIQYRYHIGSLAVQKHDAIQAEVQLLLQQSNQALTHLIQTM
ncbi:hypothetical protein D3C87_2102320 [compost metagenome]